MKKLIFGGPIYTGVGAAFAGALAGARRMQINAARIDLTGAAAFSGFNDAHMHLVEVGSRRCNSILSARRQSSR